MEDLCQRTTDSADEVLKAFARGEPDGEPSGETSQQTPSLHRYIGTRDGEGSSHDDAGSSNCTVVSEPSIGEAAARLPIHPHDDGDSSNPLSVTQNGWIGPSRVAFNGPARGNDENRLAPAEGHQLPSQEDIIFQEFLALGDRPSWRPIHELGNTAAATDHSAQLAPPSTDAEGACLPSLTDLNNFYRSNPLRA